MSITRGTAANLVGSILVTLVSLVTVPLYLRAIGHERYGVLLLFWLLLDYFGLFDLGLGRATAQRIAAFSASSEDARARVFWTALLLNAGFGILGGAVACGVAQFALRHWASVPVDLRLEAAGAVPWLALAVPLLTVSGVLAGALQGREKFLTLNVVQVLASTVSQAAPLAVAAWLAPDIRLLVPTILLTRVLTCVVLLLLCGRHVPLGSRPALDRALLRPLLGYGGWVTVTSLIGPLLSTLDRFLIGGLAGARAVTQYAVPFNLASRLGMLPGSLSSALFPRLAAVGPESAGALAERAVRGLAATLTPLSLVTMAAMRPFLSWWVGPEFSGDAASVGIIIVVGLWINGLAYIPYALLQARGRPDLVAKCHTLELVPYLLALWAGLTLWGVVGAAIAWSLRVGADAALLFLLSRARPWSLRILLPNAVLVVAMAALALDSSMAGQRQAVLAGTFLAASFVLSWRTNGFLDRVLPGVAETRGLVYERRK